MEYFWGFNSNIFGVWLMLLIFFFFWGGGGGKQMLGLSLRINKIQRVSPPTPWDLRLIWKLFWEVLCPTFWAWSTYISVWRFIQQVTRLWHCFSCPTRVCMEFVQVINFKMLIFIGSLIFKQTNLIVFCYEKKQQQQKQTTKASFVCKLKFMRITNLLLKMMDWSFVSPCNLVSRL